MTKANASRTDAGDRPQSARDRLLDAASELFYRDGIRAIGIDTILAHSGVAKMSLYRCFASKSELVAAWLERYNASYFERWDAATAAHAGNTRRQLEAVFEMVAGRVGQANYRGCAFLNTATEFPEGGERGRQIALDHKREARRRLVALAAAAGAPDPDALGDHLMLLLDGAYVAGAMFGADGPGPSVATAARTLIAAALTGS